MTKATITIDGKARAITREALLDALGLEAERLDRALEQDDRTSHPARARGACRRICGLGRVLEELGWGAEGGGDSFRLDPDRQLPVAIAAVRKTLLYAEDNARDARAHGNGEQALRATTHLRDTWETLLSLEVQGMQLRARERRRQ